MFEKNKVKNKIHKLGLILPALIILATALFFAACGKGDQNKETASGERQINSAENVVSSSADNNHTGGKLEAMTKDISAAKENKKKGKKILYWRAPMDPTYISDKPGKSAMGMDLIPVYESEEDLTGGATVVIDPITVQNIGVKTVTVVKTNLFRSIRTVGQIDYDEEKLYRINVKFTGWIEKLFVNETGQQVRKGQPMLEIYSPELVTTQEEYLLAFNNSKKLQASPFTEISKGSRSLLEATRRRLLYWDITEPQIKELEEKNLITKTMTLHSPVDGFVISKMVEEGMYIMAGRDLYRMADLSTIWVYVSIYEYELPWIKIGQKAEMDLPYIPGEVYVGKVDYIYPYLDQKARDVKIRLVFPNLGLKLKPKMYANIQIKSKLGHQVLAVSDAAVIHSGKRNLVFVAKGNGRFEPRDVVLGPAGENGYYQVLAGLQTGEEVVTSAQFLLDSESRLKEAIQKMLETRKKSKEEQKPLPMKMDSMQMEHDMKQKDEASE